MNTPTPAQALDEVMAKRPDPKLSTMEYLSQAGKYDHACGQLIDRHGQHFAGLEKEVARLGLECTRLANVALEYHARAEAAEARVRELEQQLAAAREALQAAEARAAKAEQVSDMEWNRAENLAEDIEAYHMAIDDLGLAHRVDDIGRSLSMYGRAVVSMTVFATRQRQAVINTAAELVQEIPAGSPQPTKTDATLQRDRQP